jgi:DNA-binding MarR family transcriptional regulator
MRGLPLPRLAAGARRITRTFDRELRPYRLRATQFTVLVMLSLRGDMTIGQLAEALSAERTTLTRNLALIEDAAWVKIRPARSRVVAVTDKGRAVVAKAFPAWRKSQDITAAAIGSDGASQRYAFAAFRRVSEKANQPNMIRGMSL